MFSLYLAQAVTSGLALGAVYGLMALGFCLIYNASRLINFAQGELLLLSGLGILSLVQALNLHWTLGILAACLWGFVLGLFLYATTLGLTMRAHPLRQLMLTVAASLIWQGLAILVWGKQPHVLPRMAPLPDLRLGSMYFSQDTVTAMVVSLAAGGLLHLFLRHTRTGTAVRAVSMHPLAATLQGVNPIRTYAICFALSGALAALAAMCVGPQTMLRHDMGFAVGLKGFVAATVGGYSSLGRVFLGGIFLGVLEAGLVLAFNNELKEALTFLLLIALLVVMPLGEKHAHAR